MNIPPNWELIHKSNNLTDPIRATCKAPNGKVQYIYNYFFAKQNSTQNLWERQL